MYNERSADIELLQQELDKRSEGRLTRLGIVAKIEPAILQGRGFANAVSNLPELIIYAAGKQSFGVMIARGDLAVEIGYQRLTEIQEEILRLCEAAHVPVIWDVSNIFYPTLTLPDILGREPDFLVSHFYLNCK